MFLVEYNEFIAVLSIAFFDCQVQTNQPVALSKVANLDRVVQVTIKSLKQNRLWNVLETLETDVVI